MNVAHCRDNYKTLLKSRLRLSSREYANRSDASFQGIASRFQP